MLLLVYKWRFLADITDQSSTNYILCIGANNTNLNVDMNNSIELCNVHKYLSSIFDSIETDDKEIRSRNHEERVCTSMPKDELTLKFTKRFLKDTENCV